MSSLNSRNIDYFENTGYNLNDFLYEGRVKKGIKKPHTYEELWDKLEEIRLDMFECLEENKRQLGWYE